MIDPRSEQVLLKFWSGGHNGGCLDFGKDGYLYISTGDGAIPSPPDIMNTGQDCSDLLSSVLRIDVDHSDPGRTYRIPPDNPFLNLPKVRPEIWAFGFRNPWRMSIDKATGDLWVGDVGWELWELVHKVKRGGNYGWSVMEGPQPVHVNGLRGPGPILPPIKAHPHSEAASITGGYVYHGTRLPELAGTYIYGDYQSGIIWGLKAQGDTVTWQKEIARTPIHLSAFGEGADGELYLLDHDRTHQVYRLVRNPAAKESHDFPRRLSQTGLFASTRDHQPAPGVIPYSVNSELWADGATAERFLAVPGNGRIGLDNQGIWQFPDGSCAGPHCLIARSSRANRAASAGWKPRSSTRRTMPGGLIRTFGTTTRPTRSWLMPRGRPRRIVVKTPGGSRELTHRVSARTECVLCHNPWVGKKTTIFGVQSASPLGVNSPQLNKVSESRAESGPTSSRPFTDWDSWPGRPTWRSPRGWSIPTTSQPISIAGRGPTFRPTARIATSSVREARPISSCPTTCRSQRPRPSVSGRSRGPSTSPGPGSSRLAIRRARCFITASPSSEAAACPASAQIKSTCARPG